MLLGRKSEGQVYGRMWMCSGILQREKAEYASSPSVSISMMMGADAPIPPVMDAAVPRRGPETGSHRSFSVKV
jgi:hypothetical protein